jgi:hypothetical protein
MSDDSVVTAVPMPQSDLGLINLLRDFNPNEALIEKVSGFIGAKHPGSAMFVFGWVAAAPHFILRTLRIKIRYVTPYGWQKTLGIPSSSENGSKHKTILKTLAQAKFPTLKVTLLTADALLMLDAWERGLL